MYKFFLALFSLTAFADINLDIDFKSHEKNEIVKLKQTLSMDFDKIKTIEVPNSNKVIEVKVSHRIPNAVNTNNSDDKILIRLKLIEVLGKKHNTLSSPQIITVLNREAMMEVYEDESQKKAKTILKVKATKK